MIRENERREKMCLFFASDYHFEMISMPYISENLKNNKKVVIVTENNLDDSVQKFLSNVNLDEEQKSKIMNINWNNNDVDKFKEIKESDKGDNDLIIFVKGKENYIDNINSNICNWLANKEAKVIDCYDINEVYEDVNNIAQKYDKILSTSGVEKLLK